MATVSKKGVITAKKSGTAKITVKSGKKKFVVTVTVPKTKTEKITGVPEYDQPEEGENLYLKGKTFPEGKRGEADLQLFEQKDRNCKQERQDQGRKEGNCNDHGEIRKGDREV